MSARCECGEVMGEPCQWSGPRSATVVVEWMPPQHRSSHSAAGNAGSYPHNGAVRLRCERSCAARIVEADGAWARIIGRPALGRKKVLVSLPPELLARLDAYARGEATTRGHVVQLAVAAWLDARPEHERAMCALSGQRAPAGHRVDTEPGDYQCVAQRERTMAPRYVVVRQLGNSGAATRRVVSRHRSLAAAERAADRVRRGVSDGWQVWAEAQG